MKNTLHSTRKRERKRKREIIVTISRFREKNYALRGTKMYSRWRKDCERHFPIRLGVEGENRAAVLAIFVDSTSKKQKRMRNTGENCVATFSPPTHGVDGRRTDLARQQPRPFRRGRFACNFALVRGRSLRKTRRRVRSDVSFPFVVVRSLARSLSSDLRDLRPVENTRPKKMDFGRRVSTARHALEAAYLKQYRSPRTISPLVSDGPSSDIS